jgi:hypothetical protein
MAGFTYIWEFRVAPSAQAQFEVEYGPRGSWVTLFRKAPGSAHRGSVSSSL